MQEAHLVDVADGLSHSGEGILVPVRAAQPAPDHKVVALMLPIRAHDDHHTDIVGEQVHRVVAWHCHSHLELAGQELGSIDGLRRAFKVCSKAVEGTSFCDLGVLHTGAVPSGLNLRQMCREKQLCTHCSVWLEFIPP